MNVRIYIISVVAILSVIIGLTGNLIIVVVRLYKQVQRNNITAYAFLICQLALADFIFAFTISFDIHSFLNGDQWLFGPVLCKVIKPLQSISLSTTTIFLTVMAYERYCGLSNPFRQRWSIKKTAYIVAIIWLYIIITFIPFMLALDVEGGYCFEVHHPSENFRKVYTMFLFITNYVLPLVCVTIFHTLIVLETRKHMRNMGSNTRHRGSKNVSESDCNNENKTRRANISRKINKKALNQLRNSKFLKTQSYSGSENSVFSLPNKNSIPNDFTKFLRNIFKRKKRPINSSSKTPEIGLLPPEQHVPSPDRHLQRSSTKRKSIRQRFSSLRMRNYDDQKLVNMLVAVTLCFAVMTLPSQIWYIYYDFGDGADPSKVAFQQVMEVVASLVYLHCCANCIVYSAMDKRFRTDVKNMFNTLLSKKTYKFPKQVTYLSILTRRSTKSSSSSKVLDENENMELPKDITISRETVM